MNDISPRPSQHARSRPFNLVKGPRRDYPFLVALAGTGLLAGLACYLLGLGFGRPELGIFLAALSVLVTVGIMIYILKQYMRALDQADVASPQADVSPEVPYLLTSRRGETIYCNTAYRQLMQQLSDNRIVSPLAMNFADKAERAELDVTVMNMARGQSFEMGVDILSSDGKKHALCLTVEREKEEEGYIRWMVSPDTGHQRSLHTGRDRRISLEDIGAVLAQSGQGFLAVNDHHEVIFMNAVVQEFLEPFDAGEIALPASFSELFGTAGGQVPERVTLTSRGGRKMVLDFLLIKALASIFEKQDLTCYAVTQSGVDRNSDMTSDSTTSVSGEKGVGIDRFFTDSPIGIAVVTTRGKMLERNNVFRDFLRDLGLGKVRTLEDFIEAEDYRDILGKVDDTIASGAANTVADVNFKGDADKRGQLYITRLENFAGHDAVAILYLIDTTEQKSLELQFAQSQKMQAVGQLAGGIAHDFNNLLTAITGFCDLLLVRRGPGDQSFSDIIQIKQNANRAANLVRQLLAFSRQQTLRPKVLLITDVLAELSNLLRRLIGENIELEMKHGRDLGLVKVDQGQLEQVIINLCVNARDAMPDGGRIVIRTRNVSYKESLKISQRYKVMPPNDYVLLEVEDTGTGIPKEHLGKIFEPFFSTKEVGKGTGLGLSTVYGIVKQTDGFIFPTSELGRGTVFSIYLPIHKEAGREKAPAGGEEGAGKAAKDLTGKGNILLVEDEDAVRMFASRALKNKGYKIFEASGGDKALQLVEELEGKLDLVISDVVMPQMDGPTLVKKIRETNPDLKVIFISGYAEDAFDKSMGQEDFNFLPKPFSLKQLAEQVKEVLEN